MSSSVSQSVCLCLSVRTEQLGSHSRKFHDIWCLSIFRKSIETIQSFIKSDNNNGYSTWKPIHIYDNISFSSFLNQKCFRQKLYRKSKHILDSTTIPKYRTVYEVMWKNIVGPDRPQMTIWRMRITCRITKATDINSEYVILTAFQQQQ